MLAHSLELKNMIISHLYTSLHWLPVKSRIDFKVLLLTYKALNGLAPNYLKEFSVYTHACNFSEGYNKKSSVYSSMIMHRRYSLLPKVCLCLCLCLCLSVCP